MSECHFVEVLYNYESRTARGHSVVVQPGERYVLLSDANENWWYVGKDTSDGSEDGFYLPRTYVTKTSQDVGSTFRPRTVAGAPTQRQSQIFSADGYRLLTAPVPSNKSQDSAKIAATDGKGSIRGSPGFWLASNPNRISRSIPVDLNFVHAASTGESIDIEVNENQTHINGTDTSTSEVRRSPTTVLVGADSEQHHETSPAQQQQQQHAFKHKQPVPLPRKSLERCETSGSGSKGSQEQLSEVAIIGHQSQQTDVVNVEATTTTTVESDGGGGESECSDTESATQESPSIADSEQHHYENQNGLDEHKSISNRPPVPQDNDQPLRTLFDDWGEFVESSTGRTYFHHKMTGYSSWKPPRHLVGPSQVSEFLKRTISTSTDSEGVLDATAESSTANTTGGGATTDENHQSALEESTDSALNVSPPRAKTTGMKTSQSDLPVIPTTVMATSVDSGIGRTSLSLRNKSFGLAATSLQDRNSIDLFSCPPDNLAALTNQHTGDTSKQPIKTLQPFPTYIPSAAQKATKGGTLEKCKAVDAGKKLKKQWTTCFVYLTGAHLIFYKDEKSSEKRDNHYPAPLGVCDLRGAKLKWTDGDRKHKHVFQLELIDQTVYLFSCIDTQDINSWFHAIRQLLAKLSAGSFVLPVSPRFRKPAGGAPRLPQPDNLFPTPVIEQSQTANRRSLVIRNASTSSSGSQRRAVASAALADSRRTPVKKQDTMNDHEASPETSSEQSEKRETRETILERLRRFFRSRPSLESLKQKGIYKPEPVFGSSLAEICRREKSNIPRFIRVCTALVEEKGLEVDGLYRISGNLSQIQKIRCQVDQEKYSLLEDEGDIHVVTGALKLFFRELQEPVFPVPMIKEFLDAISWLHLQIPKPKLRLHKYRQLLARMPPPHHDTLEFLFAHLLRVASLAKQNRMQVHNLAIVFGPTLFSGASEHQGHGKHKADKRDKRKQPQQQQHNSNIVDVVQSNSHLAFNMIMQGQVVEYLLKEYNKLFELPVVPSAPTSPPSSNAEIVLEPEHHQAASHSFKDQGAVLVMVQSPTKTRTAMLPPEAAAGGRLSTRKSTGS